MKEPNGERITIRESLLASLTYQYPDLSRADILHAIVKVGPYRASIEVELLRRAAERAAARVLAKADERFAAES